MRALVLIHGLMHDHATEPGLIGEWLQERGYDLTTVTVVPAERHHSPEVSFTFPAPDDWDT